MLAHLRLVAEEPISRRQEPARVDEGIRRLLHESHGLLGTPGHHVGQAEKAHIPVGKARVELPRRLAQFDPGGGIALLAIRLRHPRQAIRVVRVKGEGAAVMLLGQLELTAIDMHLAQDAMGDVIGGIELRRLARMGEGL